MINRFTRIADPWRTRLPWPRYLRHSPLRTLRERMWFVSRLEPKVNVTLNLSNVNRVQTMAAPPSTVFLHRWLATRTATLEVLREETTQSAPPKLGLPSVSMHPLASPARNPRPAYAVIRVTSARAEPAPGQPRTIAHSLLVTRLAGRTRRSDEMASGAPGRVVRRNPPAAALESTASSHETAGWGEPHKGFPRMKPGFAMGSTPTPAPAVNVEQLTDQVLKQLDRRLIASRERVGRI